jgi:predicted transcriptional regulator
MQELVEAARKVGEGNFDVQVREVKSHDELGNLTNTFNKMVESLKNMLEESPRLKQFMQFMPAAEKTTAEKEKYLLTGGTSYLIKETHSKKALDIFVDKVTHQCQGFCLSRTNPEFIKKQYHLEKTPILWLSDTKDPNIFSSSDLLILGKVVADFLTKSQKPIVLLDRIDYLIARHGFDEVLKFIIKINDKIMVTNAIFLVPVDPALIKPTDFSFLEKEMQQFAEVEDHVDLAKDLLDVLHFIESSKRLGKHVTFKDIGQKFMITSPTTQKRLQELYQKGLIHIIKTGRNKLIELTEKAYPFLHKK